MSKTGQKNSDFLELLRGVDTPVCIVDGNGGLLEKNNSFAKLINPPIADESLESLGAVLQEDDFIRILDRLTDRNSLSTITVDGVAIKREIEAGSNIFDVKIIDLEGRKEFVLIFNEILTRKIASGLSETSFRHTLLGMLTTGVSHDINNKLSVILGFAALADKKTSTDVDLKKDLAGIQAAAFDAANLVQTLVKFSRVKDDEKTVVNPSIIIKEISKFARSVVPSTITILVNVDTECGFVKTRIAPLNSLLVLIISEAIQSLSRGGELHIELCESKEEQHVVSDKIICSLIYNSDKEKKDGNRWGGIRKNRLEIIRSLATSAGISLELVTDEGKSTGGIQLIFEKYQESGPENSVVCLKKSLGFSSTDGGNILLVEDEPMLAKLLKRALEKSGYTVTIAENGKEAFCIWDSPGSGFDLVLTDRTMPVMSGTELAKKILDKQDDAKIILCTGFSDQVDEGEAMKLGIKRYLKKPVGNNELINTIKECIERD